MEFNKYQERIIEIGRKKKAKLVLPEKDDPRVSLSKSQLRALGYFLVDPEDFKSKESKFRKNLERCLRIPKKNSWKTDSI